MLLYSIPVVQVFAYILIQALTPGVNTALISSMSIKQGAWRTLPATIGASIGCGLLALFVGLFLLHALEDYPILYTALRVLGILFMLYMVVKIWNKGKPGTADKMYGFFSMVLMQISNANAWNSIIIGTVSYIPHGASWPSAVTYAGINVVCVFIGQFTWSLVGSQLGGYLGAGTRYRRFNQALAVLLLANTCVLAYQLYLILE